MAYICVRGSQLVDRTYTYKGSAKKIAMRRYIWNDLLQE